MRLQKDVNAICERSNKWEMDFNVNKCHTFRMGKGKSRPLKQYKMNERDISMVKEEEDLGVTIQDLMPLNHSYIYIYRQGINKLVQCEGQRKFIGAACWLWCQRKAKSDCTQTLQKSRQTNGQITRNILRNMQICNCRKQFYQEIQICGMVCALCPG